MKRLFAFLIVFWSVLVLREAAPALEVETLPRVLGEVKHPEWSHNVGIYEVNVRQYSSG